MSGTSNVGQASLYEAGDQRNAPAGENQPERYHEGKPNSHKALDSKDERSIANKLDSETKKSEEEDSLETKLTKKDPTLPAKSHGNEPSRGAKLDKELREEEEEELKRKGKA